MDKKNNQEFAYGYLSPQFTYGHLSSPCGLLDYKSGGFVNPNVIETPIMKKSELKILDHEK